ncbi:hypothetical protein VTK26DRAFT_3129 [Humicola hyalothermophila]
MSPTDPSFFGRLGGSIKDKLKSRSRSPSPNPGTNPFVSAPQSQAFPAAASKAPVDNKPPPPYTPVDPNPTISVHNAPGPARAPSPAPSASSARSDRSITSPEDPYAFLSSFDTIFLIDDSGSMTGSSWREVKEALRSIAPICAAHDTNGIDIYFLNNRNPLDGDDPASAGGYVHVRTLEHVEYLFSAVRPRGATPTGTRITQILGPYVRKYERAVARAGGNPDACGVKPVNMIVITDGAPTDDPESSIVSLARRLDRLDAPPHQVGIQFFQVGREAGAAEALRELDDGLAQQGGGIIRDMVDTVTWDGRDGGARVLSAEAILKVVLGAVVKRLDRKRSGGSNFLAP